LKRSSNLVLVKLQKNGVSTILDTLFYNATKKYLKSISIYISCSSFRYGFKKIFLSNFDWCSKWIS